MVSSINFLEKLDILFYLVLLYKHKAIKTTKLMTHYSPIPPSERAYSPNYKKELEPYETLVVTVIGTVFEITEHPKRADLQGVMLHDLYIIPPNGKTVRLSHLWTLTRYLKRLNIVDLKPGDKVEFKGAVYAYYRMGGRNAKRGLVQTHDFAVLPMNKRDLAKYEPGLSNRYPK